MLSSTKKPLNRTKTKIAVDIIISLYCIIIVVSTVLVKITLDKLDINQSPHFCKCSSETIEVPKDITEIPDDCFANCGLANTYILHDGIVKIGSNAFAGVTNAYMLSLPDSVIEIGTSAFAGSNFREILLGTQLQRLGIRAFENARNLQRVNLANSKIKILGIATFQHCYSLEEVKLPNTLIEIRESSFYNCSNLKNIDLPDSITTIGEQSFMYSGLTKLKIPLGLTSIPVEAFRATYSLTTVTFHENLYFIGESAFNGSKIGNLNFPAKASILIEDSAFEDCSSLSSISGGIVSIGRRSFAYCRALIFADISKALIIGQSAFSSDYKLAIVLLSPNLTYLPESIFSSCGITSITLPKNLQEIGNYAFQDSKLESLTIPDSLITISENAFYGAAKLKSVTFGNNPQLQFIKRWAFGYCSSLKSIWLPPSVLTVESYAFYYYLRNITLCRNTYLSSWAVDYNCTINYYSS